MYILKCKSDWLLETFADAYGRIEGSIAIATFDPKITAPLETITQQAIQRLDPF